MTRLLMNFARIVLQAKTPLSITEGGRDSLFDTRLARDASGLPAIPASSLKGALRALYSSLYGDAATRELFGYVDPGSMNGRAARLDLSWGTAHGSDDLPAAIVAPRDEKEMDGDDLLLELRALATRSPLLRRRTKINAYGAAAAKERGQFDRSIVPAGARFTVQLSMRCATAEDEENWRRVLALFAHPLLRLGGVTRSGLGAIEIARDDEGLRAYEASYALCEPDDYQAFIRDRRALFDLAPATQERRITRLGSEREAKASGVAFQRSFELRSESFWRIGGGIDGVLGAEAGKEIDEKALTEPIVDWSQSPPRVGWREKKVIIPGAAIKGALRHRTAFHFARSERNFAAIGIASAETFADTCPAVRALFGEARVGGDEGEGRRGRVIIDDIVLATRPPAGRLAHNSIDRFTGGVRDHLLFDEEALSGGSFPVSIIVQSPPRDAPEDERYIAALELAVDDLERGWLTLGAGARSGHGVFRGDRS